MGRKAGCELGSVVQVVALNVPATIDAIMVTLTDKVQYRVVYWYEGERRTEWVYREEIK